MAPLKRAAIIRLATLKLKLRRICYEEKASHPNQVLLLSVLRDDEKRKKKRAAEKKTGEKWRVENGIQFGTSVGGVLEIGNCAVFFCSGAQRQIA